MLPVMCNIVPFADVVQILQVECKLSCHQCNYWLYYTGAMQLGVVAYSLYKDIATPTHPVTYCINKTISVLTDPLN